MSEIILGRERLEDIILYLGEKLSDSAHRRYVEGQLGVEELKIVHAVLRRWSSEGELLLELLTFS